MIVTLAGHVDHGKSALVRALTGVTTDRLAEEQRRGLTLDLGFAYTNFGGNRVGFVDVPGHHRFIHNMVAGVAADQFALLVVAADDGVMPQTREHLDILRTLALGRGCIALTKSDLVSTERIAAVRAELAQLTAGSFLADAEIFPCNTQDAGTLAQLREHLAAAAAGAPAAEQADDAVAAPFRLAIDRSFTLSGAGCVVTGTVHSGAISKGDSLVLGTQALPVRVRDLRVQDASAETARAGDRAAVNLAGIDHQQAQRGAWLLDASAHNATQTLVVEFDAIAGVRLKHWSRVHVHLATAHALGQLALLTPTATNRSLVELVLASPLQAKHGDRVVVRDYARQATLGGGGVIYAGRAAARRRSPLRLASLGYYHNSDPQTALSGLLDTGPVTLSDWRATYLLTAHQAQAIPNELGAVPLPTNPELWARADELARVAQQVQAQVAAAPGGAEAQGLSSAELARTLAAPLPLVQAAAHTLVQQQKLRNVGGRLHAADFGLTLSEQLQTLLQRCKPLLEAEHPASLGDLSKALNVPLATLDRALQQVAKAKALVRIGAKRYGTPEQVQRWAQLASDLSAVGPFSVKEFRDRSKLGRNMSIDVLEHFDSKGFTRRSGDTRTVAGSSASLG